MSRDSKKNIDAVLHDVRQMLAVISGRVGILRLQSDHEKTRKNLDAMEIAAIDAGKMLARLQAEISGELPLEEAPGDIQQALLQSANLIQPGPGVDWMVEPNSTLVTTDGRWRLHLDALQGCRTAVPQSVLREVLNNLFLNSLNVMPDGGTISVHLDQVDDHWHLRFEDSGPGIPLSRRERVFDEGFTTSGDSAKGIGLGHCRGLLGRYGASLTLVSGKRDGACFELSLPVAASAGALEQISEEARVDFEPTVLIVDDELSVRDMLSEVLEELGCRIEVARDGTSAEGIFPSKDFEMVIIDQTLPGMSGLDLAGIIRRENKTVVLVLMSGWGHPLSPDLIDGSVVDFFVEKPMTLGDLKNLLNTAGKVYQRRQDNS